MTVRPLPSLADLGKRRKNTPWGMVRVKSQRETPSWAREGFLGRQGLEGHTVSSGNEQKGGLAWCGAHSSLRLGAPLSELP